MSNLSDKQWESHIWLSRMWGKADIISSLSGIGKYDDTFIPANTGENATETKNIEYSLLNQKIEKLLNVNKLLTNARNHICDTKYRKSDNFPTFYRGSSGCRR